MLTLQTRKRPSRLRPQRPRRQECPSSTPSLPAAALALLAASARNRFPHYVLPAVRAQCDPCEGTTTGFVQIPGTDCTEFAQCSGGAISQRYTCQGGLIYDSNLSQCNWAASASCGPDPECHTPLLTPAPAEPTAGPTAESSTDAATAAPPPGGVSVTTVPIPLEPRLPASPVASASFEPVRREHHAAVWAHLGANKIAISNQLLRAAYLLHSVRGGDVKTDELRDYTYHDFYGALRSMAEEGYVVSAADDPVDAVGNPLLTRNVFYLGDPDYEDAAAVGLVNVAAFLSQAMADSISSGSCDEINMDVVDGVLPASNSCGQFGRSYQDMRCPNPEERFMECAPYGGMEMAANVNGWPVSPFYCGSRKWYPVVGSAEYIPGRTPVDGAVPNRNGRTDVEGCCWWGRGTLQTRGVCQYGKLNYYLGARAAQEGRPSRYPHIDFCSTPQRICSAGRGRYSEIEWVAGLFRWVEDVQSYDDGAGWNYIQKLREFVAGGMVDGMFVREVSLIVTGGCHWAPCPDMEGGGGSEKAEDAMERWSFFLQALEAMGLPTDALRQG